MKSTNPPITILTLPPELRNAIYDLLFTEPSPYLPSPTSLPTPTSPPSLSTFGHPSPLNKPPLPLSHNHPTALLQSCKLLHSETHLLYLSRTPFTLSASHATPEHFAPLIAPLSVPQISAIRHIVLTGRINNMRALNESWNGRPFNNPHLSLSTLTLVPRRPVSQDAYSHVADLSQSHTLAYILSETLKGLKGVEKVVVRNEENAFSEAVWRLVYRGSVWRLWRWAGSSVGLMFRRDGSGADAWFEILVGLHGRPEDGWREAHEEIQRLII